MGNSSGQRLCPRSVSGASAPLSHTHGLCLPGCSSSCLSAGVLPCSKGRGTWCLLPSDHTDPAALSCPRTAGHAVCSPWHKDQGCPGMEQAEIPGPSTAGHKYCGVHCLTQLWQWECQQLPCIFSLQLSPARQQGQHREQPGIWRHRAAKNAKPRLALLFPTSVTKSMAELKHRRGCDL